MASPENINMEPESPEVQDENQSEEDEVISKNDLRESDKTLDDPSQFYFDDDLPTPEEEEEEDNETEEQNDNEENQKAGKKTKRESRQDDFQSEDGDQSNEEDSLGESEEEEEEEEEIDRELEEQMMKFYEEHGYKFSDEKDDFETPEAYIEFVKRTMENYRASLEADYLQDGSEDSYEDMKGDERPGKYVRNPQNSGGNVNDDEETMELEENSDEEEDVLMEDGAEENACNELSGAESEGESENVEKVVKEEDRGSQENCKSKSQETEKAGEKDLIDSKTDVSKDISTRNMRSRRSINPKEITSPKQPSEKVDKSDHSEGKKVDTKSPSVAKSDTGSCLGLATSQFDLDKIRLNKEYLLARIESIEKFLDSKLSAKELKEAFDKEEKLAEQLELKRRPKVAAKRKLDDSQTETVVKKDGRGRPLGWRKPKPEPDPPSNEQKSIVQSSKPSPPPKPLVKRSKKDQLLLLKALDEEMFKMDEESNKEMERISQGLDYQCSVCSQVFIEKKNLSKHFFKCLMKFTQSGRSSFKCAVCFEYFSLLENLESHIERKHGNVCDDPFQCSQCSLCFSQGSDLKDHILKKHEVFQCEHCEKYYRSQHMLDVHVSKKHPGARSKSGRGRKERRNSAAEKTEQTSTSSQQSEHTDTLVSDVKVKQEPEENVPTATLNVNSKTENDSNVQIKTENSEPVRTKKLGRPFKRKTNDADSPVSNSLKPNGVVEPEVKTPQSPRANKFEAVKTPNSTSEEETELGRGRRVKKKKTLDYDDLSLTGRTRKSVDSSSISTQNDTKNSPLRNDAKQDLDLKLEANKVAVLSPNVFRESPTPDDSIAAEESSEPAKLDPISNDQKVDPASVQNDVDTSRDSNCDTSKDSNTFCPSELVETHLSPQHSPEDSPTPKEAGSNSEPTTPEKMELNTSNDQSAEPSPAVHVNRKVHTCPKCRKPFAHKYLVEMHMKWKHNIYIRKAVGEDNSDGESSSGKDPTAKKAKRHRTPNSARGALFICALCPESFNKFSGLDNHYSTVHDGIPCHVCRIIIKNRILLDKHMSTCHREEDRNVCLVCMKQMASKATLRKHIVMHEDRRPYDCVVCKRSFRYSYDMRLHMRRTHRGVLGESSEDGPSPVKKSPGRPKVEKS